MLSIAVIYLSAAVVVGEVVHIPQQFFSRGYFAPVTRGCSFNRNRHDFGGSIQESEFFECDGDSAALETAFDALDCSGSGVEQDLDAADYDCSADTSNDAYVTVRLGSDGTCDGAYFETMDFVTRTCYPIFGSWSILYCLRHENGSSIYQETFSTQEDCTQFEYPSEADSDKLWLLMGVFELGADGVCTDGGSITTVGGGADSQCPRALYCPDFVDENPIKNSECAHICNLVRSDCLTDTGGTEHCHNVKTECLHRCQAFIRGETVPACYV